LGCFFRDDGLSDLIGFTYADWHAEDAVANLIGHLRTIAKVDPNNGDRVVSIILDGENAWEYYPENGYHFLSTLYSELADHPEIELTTFGAAVTQGVDLQPLDSVVAGSWVYGTFSTWIGDTGKNRGWELLVEAKRAYDQFAPDDPSPELVRQLGVCEGSDWFWWFGDYNPAAAVSDFDDLYRGHLKALYRALGQEVPASLDTPISSGSGVPEAGGVMRRGQA
jgi:alpha-amylase/alpha-mannosidase (GH57 family)